jgi:hypothetical protein
MLELPALAVGGVARSDPQGCREPAAAIDWIAAMVHGTVCLASVVAIRRVTRAAH